MRNLSEKRIRELERAERKLLALEAGGVTNWEWYSESLSDFFKEEEREDLFEEYTQSLLELVAEADVSAEDSRNGLYIVTIEEDRADSLLRSFAKALEEVDNQ